MKITHADVEKEKVFEPFTFIITIESEKELMDLWHRTNLSVADMKGHIKEVNGIHIPFTNMSSPIWNYLESMRQQRMIEYRK